MPVSVRTPIVGRPPHRPHSSPLIPAPLGASWLANRILTWTFQMEVKYVRSHLSRPDGRGTLIVVIDQKNARARGGLHRAREATGPGNACIVRSRHRCDSATGGISPLRVRYRERAGARRPLPCRPPIRGTPATLSRSACERRLLIDSSEWACFAGHWATSRFAGRIRPPAKPAAVTSSVAPRSPAAGA